MDARTRRRLELLVILVALVMSCHSDDRPAPDEDFVSPVPAGEIPGRWVLSEGRRLDLRVGGACDVSPGLAEYLVNCEHSERQDTPSAGPCSWRVETQSDNEWLGILFDQPKGVSRLVHLSVYRRRGDRQLVLYGTCGMGDAYPLVRAGA